MTTISEIKLIHSYNELMAARDCREADIKQVLAQIGASTICATAGSMRRVYKVTNIYGEYCGVILYLGGSRFIEIVLDWDDTYSVRRLRQINRGSNKGGFIVEYQVSGIYCDQVSEITYKAGCWK